MKNPKENTCPVEDAIKNLVLDINDIDEDLECLYDRIECLHDRLDEHAKHIDAVFDDTNDAWWVAVNTETKLNKNLPWLWIAVGLEAIVIVLQLFNII